MKIGIITFHRAVNYGALLQAYALRSVLRKNEADAEIVDYRNELIESLYKPKSFSDEKGIRGKLHYLMTYRRDHNKIKKFEHFRKEYLGINENNIYTDQNIAKSNEEYDIFVSGSDQVWNPKAHDFDKHYYLDFVSNDNKKFSYAASFGENIEEGFYADLKPLLEDFKVCSIREKHGCQIVKNISNNIETRTDIDPVFLMNRDEWKKSLNLSVNNKKYVLVYLFRITNKTKELITKFYNQGIEVVYLGKPLRNPFDVPVKFIPSAGPVDFVDYFFNASFVITNSFHGTAFSVIFNKPFALELFINTSRLENLTEITSLRDRIYDDTSDFDELLNRKIEWNSVNEKIAILRKDSIDYIKGMIING